VRAPPPLPAYVGNYIGAPYKDAGEPPKSFNCWQLFAHVQRCERGVALPDYDGPVWSGRAGLEAMHEAAEAFASRFAEVDPADVREGDAILLRLNGAPIHIGLVVASGWMLHINKGIDACLECYRDPLWRDRIIGFYRP
jgi:cell wall-associated NlpC family hydrolase